MTIKSNGLESQSDAVVAIALACGPGAVIEHMTLVTAAAAAVVFRARNDQFEIYFRGDRPGQRFKEAGPTGATVEFRLG